VETTFTATVDGLEPFTYDWIFGDDGGVASGNPVTHTFTMSVTTPVSLTVTNDYGTAAIVKRVLVFDPGTEPPSVYLPLVGLNAP
jgi:PKD repeat protein